MDKDRANFHGQGCEMIYGDMDWETIYVDKDGEMTYMEKGESGNRRGDILLPAFLVVH